MPRHLIAVLAPLIACAVPSGEVHAEPLADMQARLDAQETRIRELEAALARLTGASSPPGNPALSSSPVASPAIAPPVAVADRFAADGSALKLSGDIRTRYEFNTDDADGRDRGRGVLRARFRAAYAINDWLTAGGQIATGDPDDPNSTDITLGSFDDDLNVSLDQAYLKVAFAAGKGSTYLGKMPLPFVRSELVWDGDVSPQGVSTSLKLPVAGGELTASALYFLVDESVAGPDSDMVGAQIGLQSQPTPSLKLEAHASYYDYALRSTAGGDAGDFRSNRLIGGRYLSDFNLVDVIGSVSWAGLGSKWPIKIVGDYVRNLGAVDDDDSGFGLDVLLGNANAKGDWRFGYGYAEADVDAVLAAFSQDNTNIATNYLQHSLSIDYVARRGVFLNATLYHYRPKSALFAGRDDAQDWLTRLRLNLLVSF